MDFLCTIRDGEWFDTGIVREQNCLKFVFGLFFSGRYNQNLGVKSGCLLEFWRRLDRRVNVGDYTVET
jgi:hypothetical protein